MKKGKKQERIIDRRREVLNIVEFKGSACFDDIVKKTGFSRNEVAYHLYILKRHNRIGTKDGNIFFYRMTWNESVSSLREFMYGSPNPTHIYGVGHIGSKGGRHRRYRF